MLGVGFVKLANNKRLGLGWNFLKTSHYSTVGSKVGPRQMIETGNVLQLKELLICCSVSVYITPITLDE